MLSEGVTEGGPVSCPICLDEGCEGPPFCLAMAAEKPTELPRAVNFGATEPVPVQRPAFDNDPVRRAPIGNPLPKVRGALIERAGEDGGKVHALKEGRNKLGRDAGCDVVVADVRASADHGYLFIKADGTGSYHDVSRNGTLVDGRTVRGDVLAVHHGSVLQIGVVRLMVLLVPGNIGW